MSVLIVCFVSSVYYIISYYRVIHMESNTAMSDKLKNLSVIIITKYESTSV